MLQKFIKYIRYEKGYSSHTVLSYNNDLTQFETYLKEQVEDVDIVHVDADIVRHYIVWLMDKGVTARSVGRKLSSLRTFYKYMIKLKVIESSPVALVAKPKGPKPLPSFVKQTEMATLLDDLELEDDGTFVEVGDRLLIDWR